MPANRKCFFLLLLCMPLVYCAGRLGKKAARPANEAELRAALQAGGGIVELPPGRLVISRDLVIPDKTVNLEIRGHPNGSTLEAAGDFQGRAMLVAGAASGLLLSGFRVEGNRSRLTRPLPLPPSDVPFAGFYSNNGILLREARKVVIRRIEFKNIANYPLLISACSNVLVEEVKIEDSGSLNSAGRNNASGGILIEEGTTDFVVRRCLLRRVRGNGIWTHSNFRSPRNAGGVIVENEVYDAARDAIQVGHATNVKVERNRGARIGYPVGEVDIESQAYPVALDTAGNVDRSAYLFNRFEDVNGQCIDLDGFHHGEVRGNSCLSRKPFEEYPHAHAGIVFGNTHPDVRSEQVLVAENEVIGAGYGGIFLIGSGHRILNNRLLDLNRAECTGDPVRPRCNYAPEEPGLLRSGIYLARGAARPARAEDNRIEGNEVGGFGMGEWCVGAAPGVSPAKNQIRDNRCQDRR